MTYAEHLKAHAIEHMLDLVSPLDDAEVKSDQQMNTPGADLLDMPKQGSWAPASPSEAPGERYPTAEVHVNNKKLKVKVADTPALRRIGLQNTADAGAGGGLDGLLFRYPADAQAALHNANVNFPVSATWFDSSGMYVDHAHMLPQDASPRHPKGPHRYILETSPEKFDALGIGPGTQMSIAEEKEQENNGTIDTGGGHG